MMHLLGSLARIIISNDTILSIFLLIYLFTYLLIYLFIVISYRSATHILSLNI